MFLPLLSMKIGTTSLAVRIRDISPSLIERNTADHLLSLRDIVGDMCFSLTIRIVNISLHDRDKQHVPLLF